MKYDALLRNLGKPFALLISSITMPVMSFGPAEKLKPAGGFGPHDLRNRVFWTDGLLCPAVGVTAPEDGVEPDKVGVDGDAGRLSSFSMVESIEAERLLPGRRRNLVNCDRWDRGVGAATLTAGVAVVGVDIVSGGVDMSAEVGLRISGESCRGDWKSSLPNSSSSRAESESPSSELIPLSANAVPPTEERTVPIPSV